MTKSTNQRPDSEKSSHERVMEWIRDGLHAGRFVPGQKLVEAELMNTLGVSRGPVREALKRLQGEGIVDLQPHRGAHLRAYTRARAAHLLRVMEPLTGLMAQLAAEAVAEGAPAKSLADMHGWIEQFRRGELHVANFVGKRQHFYDSLMQIGGNSELPSIMPVEGLHLLRLQSFPYLDPKDRQNILDEYIRIMDAVIEGDPQRAQRAAIAHVRAAQKRLAGLPDYVFPTHYD